MKVDWSLNESDSLRSNAVVGGIPLVQRGGAGLLGVKVFDRGGAECSDALVVHSKQELLEGGVLRLRVTLRQSGDRLEDFRVRFVSSAQPSGAYGTTRLHLPLTAQGLMSHPTLTDLGTEQIASCLLDLGMPGQGGKGFVGHYREPTLSSFDELTSRATLLIPLMQWFQPVSPVHISLFGSPELGWRFGCAGDVRGKMEFSAQTLVSLARNQEVHLEMFLAVSEERIESSWEAFHRIHCSDAAKSVEWTKAVRVHYYDFLSPGFPDGKRGMGYPQNAELFSEFKVGMATQHGYYPCMGDYLVPGRSSWDAMSNDHMGGFSMSIDELRRRIELTRKQGARANIYLHTSLCDRKALNFAEIEPAMRLDVNGRPFPYSWNGPDVPGQTVSMSMANPLWREHLLKHAASIMDVLNPDALVIDETFAGLGYDYRNGKPEAMSTGMIEFLKKLREIVRAKGEDKAVFSSDCALGSFVLWCDGEGGDHAYDSLLGDERYRDPPIRYLAALSNKPWLPCNWQQCRFWDAQIDLSRKLGTGIGVANGWIEYAGLKGLPAEMKKRMLQDIRSLETKTDS
ncbi:MAG: hypothetical protein JJU20_00490 [Opitutales bacterium]|nr:hypothetical protein [Opitutales bacterium]